MASPFEMRSTSNMTCWGLISSTDRAGLSGCLLFPGADLTPPGLAALGVANGHLGFQVGQNLDDPAQDAFGVADDGQVGGAVLADFGRVDIDVDDLGVRGEGGEAAGDAIVEAHAHGDHEVAAGHRHVRGVTAVHAGHADEVGMAAGEAAQTHQGANDRKVHQFDQLQQLGRGARGDDAAAGIDQRTLGVPDHLGGAAGSGRCVPRC